MHAEAYAQYFLLEQKSNNTTTLARFSMRQA